MQLSLAVRDAPLAEANATAIMHRIYAQMQSTAKIPQRGQNLS